MLLRTARLDDIDGIMAVEQQAFIPSIQEQKSVFIERLSVFSEGFFVVCDDSEIQGYISCEIWDSFEKNEKSFGLGHSIKERHRSDGNILYISSVALLDECKGKGLGQLLFSECIKRVSEKFAEINEYVLIVNEVWKGAYHIYSKNGFKELFRIKGFFPSEDDNATDGIVMGKTI